MQNFNENFIFFTKHHCLLLLYFFIYGSYFYAKSCVLLFLTEKYRTSVNINNNFSLTQLLMMFYSDYAM